MIRPLVIGGRRSNGCDTWARCPNSAPQNARPVGFPSVATTMHTRQIPFNHPLPEGVGVGVLGFFCFSLAAVRRQYQLLVPILSPSCSYPSPIRYGMGYTNCTLEHSPLPPKVPHSLFPLLFPILDLLPGFCMPVHPFAYGTPLAVVHTVQGACTPSQNPNASGLPRHLPARDHKFLRVPAGSHNQHLLILRPRGLAVRGGGLATCRTPCTARRSEGWQKCSAWRGGGGGR